MVTLKDSADLDDFYTDMETPGGDLYIPDRAVGVNNKREISRTTEYWLTEQESRFLKDDSRVAFVELNPKDRGIEVSENHIEQTGNFHKANFGTFSNNSYKNWGLWRCWDGNPASNAYTGSKTKTIKLGLTGKNVDAVICDGNGGAVMDDHPEFQKNADGSGGTRFYNYNWYQWNPQVTGGSAGTYTYNGTSNHAHHVAGTVVGNTQGWARDANLYHLYYLSGASFDYNFPYVMDYIRLFHQNKSVNSETKIKNPTVVNNSWGMSIFPSQWSFNDITEVTYRGTTYTRPVTSVQENGQYGVYGTGTELANFSQTLLNRANRITTSGSETAANGDFGTTPSGWSRSGAVMNILISADPPTQDTVQVQGPAVIDVQYDLAASSVSGIQSMTLEIDIRDDQNNPIQTSITGSDASTESGETIQVNLAQSNISLPNNEVYNIIYNTTTSLGTSPTVAGEKKATIVGYTPATAQATTSDLGEVSIDSTNGLTASVTPTTGTNNNGFWEIDIPFNVNYISTNYNKVYIGTNSYLTFGNGSTNSTNISSTNPGFPKIMVGAADRSAQRVWYGATGTVGDRIFRLVYEGSSQTSGTLGSPTVRYEYQFKEANPSQIDLIVEQNANTTTTTSAFSSATLQGFGFISGQRIPVRVNALDSDLEDLEEAGVIFCGAAGNGYWKHDLPGGPDWDNKFKMEDRYPGQEYYYHRGTSPTANDNVAGGGTHNITNITVGATQVETGVTQESRIYFSDHGPGVDIWAPGHNIVSAYYTNTGVGDTRNSSRYLGRISGTSMASPQVAGILCCLAERYPNLNQDQMKKVLQSVAKPDQLYDSTSTTGNNNDYTDTNALNGAPNLYAFYPQLRPFDGRAFPYITHLDRPTSGAVYPRTNRTFRG